MKGFRFYAARDGRQECIAVYTEVGPQINRNAAGGVVVEGLASVFARENSPVCWTGISTEYLRERYRRVSERKAREIHPALFRYLDA